jgi:ankyrin repeat protein
MIMSLAASVTAAAAAFGALAARTAQSDEEEDAVRELILAARDGRVAVLQHLVEEARVIHVDARAEGGDTALATAAAAGQVEALLMLLSLGADHRALCRNGALAIHAAARHGHVATMQPLLDLGHFWACAADADGLQPLHCAAAEAHFEAVSALLAEMVPVDARSGMRRTPLMLAAGSGRNGAVACVKLLLHSHADVNAVDSAGDTPLHALCRVHRDEGMTRERSSGTGNAREDEGRGKSDSTDRGSNGGLSDPIAVLCSAGARLFIQNRAGDTPFDIAGDAQRDALDRVLASRQRQGEYEANAFAVARGRLIDRMRAMARHDPMALQALCDEPETRRLLARFRLTGFRISMDDVASGGGSSGGFTSSALAEEGLPLAEDDGGAELQRESPRPRTPPTARVTRSLQAMLGSLDAVGHAPRPPRG